MGEDAEGNGGCELIISEARGGYYWVHFTTHPLLYMVKLSHNKMLKK